MRRLILLIIILCWGTSAFAEDPVKAAVDRTRVALGESLQMEVTITGSKGDVSTDPIKDFKVISRGTTNRINMVNGSFSQTLVYAFTLVPLRQGRLKIPALPVRIDGKTVRTNEINITVTKNSAAPSDAGDVFVDAEISNPSPFESEQIVYTFRLYRRLQIANARFQQPDFSGFTVKPFEEQQTYEKVVSGRKFHVTEVRFLLIPLKAGTLQIKPSALSCDLVRRSNRRQSIFDDPFFSSRRFESRVFQTEPVNVTVRPLPPYSGTEPFSGLAGRFSARSGVENSKLRVNDSTTFWIEISGTGNIIDAAEPAITFPDALKTYQDTPEESIEMTEEGYRGKKVFRTALVPVREGSHTIPSFSLVYFDVQKAEYQEIKTAPITLTAAPAEKTDALEVVSPSQTSTPLFKKKKVEFTGRDILPLKEQMDALEPQRPLKISFFILILAIPAVFYAGCILIRSYLQKGGTPGSRMTKQARNALELASRPGIDEADFLSAVYQAMISAVYARAGREGVALTCDEAAAMLKEADIPETAAQTALELLEKIETVKFSSGAIDDTFRTELLEKTRQWINKGS